GQMNFIAGTTGERAGWVRVGKAELRCPTGERVVPGTRVTLAIRPEEILVGPAAGAADNRLLTRIRSVQFLGAFPRLRLTLPDDSDTALECDVAANAFADL